MRATDKLIGGQRLPPLRGGLRALGRSRQEGAVEVIALVESAHIR
jgi:hypothetical protein